MSEASDKQSSSGSEALAPETLQAAVAEAEKAFAAAGDLDELAAVKPAHLGDQAPVPLAKRAIGSLPKEEKADAGKRGRRVLHAQGHRHRPVARWHEQAPTADRGRRRRTVRARRPRVIT